jgi:CBS domain-containing protein
MSDRVASIRPDASLVEAARILVHRDIGVLVVRGKDVDRPAGVVSERDLVRAVAGGRDLESTRTMDVAHTDLSWADASATVAEVADEMMDRYIRHVLVERNGHLVGVVSARDLLGAYAAADLFVD